MKPIAKIDCRINDIYYAKGDEIKVDNIEQLKKLNERGFIEPLTEKDMQDYFRKPEIKKIFNKEEE
jgi:hypothetical protein